MKLWWGKTAVEYSLWLVSASSGAGSTWTQQFLRLCLGCLEFLCKIALHRVKSSLFWLNCSWQSVRAGTLERSSSYLCLLIRGGCRVHPVCLLSPFRLTFIRIRASNAVQMKCCYWVHLTKPESDAQQWAHYSVMCKGDSTGKTPSQFSLLDPYSRCALIFQSCQLL